MSSKATDDVDALLHHNAVSAVSFVGSTPIARYIYETAAQNGKRAQAWRSQESHGHLPDADMEQAADALMGAAYGRPANAHGDLRRVPVGAKAASACSKARPKFAHLKIRPGTDPDAEMGPL